MPDGTDGLGTPLEWTQHASPLTGQSAGPPKRARKQIALRNDDAEKAHSRADGQRLLAIYQAAQGRWRARVKDICEDEPELCRGAEQRTAQEGGTESVAAAALAAATFPIRPSLAPAATTGVCERSAKLFARAPALASGRHPSLSACLSYHDSLSPSHACCRHREQLVYSFPPFQHTSYSLQLARRLARPAFRCLPPHIRSSHCSIPRTTHRRCLSRLVLS